jgi:hypothetical protein
MNSVQRFVFKDSPETSSCFRNKLQLKALLGKLQEKLFEKLHHAL